MEYKLKNLTRKSKILSATHNDLDGVSSQIVLGNVFDKKNIEYKSLGYNKIVEFCETVKWQDYDFVIMTDVSPSIKPESLDRIENLILLDHHETALQFHDPKRMRVVDMKTCATKLVQKFCTNHFKIDLSYLDRLVELVNDYDLWIHNDPKSWELNLLYYFHWATKFRRRFFNGYNGLNDEERKFIREKRREFDIMWKNLTVYKLDSINACFVEGDMMINDLCHKLLNDEDYDFVLCRNSHSKTISFRSKHPDVHIGNILDKLGLGGGHKLAAGFGPLPLEDLDVAIENIENEIYKELKGK